MGKECEGSGLGQVAGTGVGLHFPLQAGSGEVTPNNEKPGNSMY